MTTLFQNQFNRKDAKNAEKSFIRIFERKILINICDRIIRSRYLTQRVELIVFSPSQGKIL